MKAQDIPDFKQKVLDMLPITQAEVWKNLGIGRRDGSKLVSIMLEENLIKRTKSDNTFLLESTNGTGKKEKSKKPKGSPLLSKSGKLAPCCGCNIGCVPSSCIRLTEWMLD